MGSIRATDFSSTITESLTSKSSRKPLSRRGVRYLIGKIPAFERKSRDTPVPRRNRRGIPTPAAPAPLLYVRQIRNRPRTERSDQARRLSAPESAFRIGDSGLSALKEARPRPCSYFFLIFPWCTRRAAAARICRSAPRLRFLDPAPN